jgi:type IV secretory pathway VirB3-like protein
MVKLVATKLSTYLPVTKPTMALEVALHLAGIFLMTQTNEMFTIKSQQVIIIIVIMIIAYHKVVCKPNYYALQAKDQNIIWKNMISSYDSVMEFISAYNSVDFHILSVVAMKSTVHTERMAQFDTDSGPVGIDNRCSACFSLKRADFIGELFPCTRTIKGFGGTRVSSIHMGTLQWHWDDDQGVTHQFLIPNSYYVPEGKVRLLSPQH